MTASISTVGMIPRPSVSSLREAVGSILSDGLKLPNAGSSTPSKSPSSTRRSSGSAPWDNKCELGLIGEKLVAQYLKEKESYDSVELSENRFDDQKDIIADDETIEVKTFLRFFKYNGFLLEESQWRKIDGVDRFFIVELPWPTDEIRVWEVVEKSSYKKIKLYERLHRCYSVLDTSLLWSFTDPVLAKTMRDLSPSTWIKK